MKLTLASLGVVILGLTTLSGSSAAPATPAKPNIIIILADDLGYGDIGCYGATRIQTPNIDRLGKEGLRFTDAHSTSSTCTPARYGLLTGEYPWRKKSTGILPGDAALIIEPGRTTLASLLQRAGYATAVVGKWHLGLGSGSIDWNSEIKPGPREVGFDYSFIMPATCDRVPCVYLENQRVAGLDPQDPIRVNYKKPFPGEPTGLTNPELLKLKASRNHCDAIINGISRMGFMTGGKSALWKDEDMGDTFLSKVLAFIEQNKTKPFFAYYALHEPHVPRVPHSRFVGKTTLGPRGDAIVQLDWEVGEVLKVLDRLGLGQNTMVMLSSDNGPVLNDGYMDGAAEKTGDHKPAGPLHGGKYSIYEGGTRVPLLVRWPAHIKPGSSDALVCQVDFLTSFAVLTGQTLSPNDGPDSFNVLPALLGETKSARDTLVEHAGSLALRDGAWKFVHRSEAKRSKAAQPAKTGTSELYNLADDIGETRDLNGLNTNRATQAAERLQQIRDVSRSRP